MVLNFRSKNYKCHPKTPIFWNFWSKMTNLFKSFFFFFFFSFFTNHSNLLNTICFWNFVTKRPLFCVKSCFSPKDPSFFFFFFFCKFCLNEHPLHWKSEPYTHLFYMKGPPPPLSSQSVPFISWHIMLIFWEMQITLALCHGQITVQILHS